VCVCVCVCVCVHILLSLSGASCANVSLLKRKLSLCSSTQVKFPHLATKAHVGEYVNIYFTPLDMEPSCRAQPEKV
jgi:hypothetical protein